MQTSFAVLYHYKQVVERGTKLMFVWLENNSCYFKLITALPGCIFSNAFNMLIQCSLIMYF